MIKGFGLLLASAMALSACVTTGNYASDWTPIPKSQSKISFDAIEDLGRCVEVDAIADQTQYLERHACKTGSQLFFAVYEVLRDGYAFRGTNSDDEFRDNVMTVFNSDGAEVSFEDIGHVTTDLGTTYFSRGSADNKTCFFFSGSYGTARLRGGKGVTSRMTGGYCGPEETVARINIDTYNKALIVRSQRYNGGGMPVAASEADGTKTQ